MRAVIQRCMSEASVEVNNQITGSIDKGLVILLGIEDEDTERDIEWLARKILQMRIFSDEEEKMNLSVQDIQGGVLIISQFTLHASIKKGNRPSFIRAAKPDYAERMYKQFVDHIKRQYKIQVATGQFAAHMNVRFINDGPVTILIDSKNPE
ncbi:MAG: D-tyrosyl-tRNA(Tyr) deacylase [Saprospiraceae bacterium]|nr:D-tyrosyl-tRNA(Tyr) deacylase [Saprospiraceae bacterium]